MTLAAWLASLRADQVALTGPTLIVAEGALSEAQREEVIGSTYNRRPYVVLAYRNRAAPRRTHLGDSLMVGAVDVNMHHPSSGLSVPDGDVLAKLQAVILTAQDFVDEIRAGYDLASPLKVASEIDPHPDPESKLGGLRAVTRFTYALWR